MIKIKHKLVQELDILSPNDAQNFRDAYKFHLDSQLAAVPSHQPTADMLGGKWSGLVWPGTPTSPSMVVHNPDTGLDLDTLRRVGQHSVEVPEGFVCHIFSFKFKEVIDTSCHK